MNTGHWFNPCDYSVDDLPGRILEELYLWDEDQAEYFEAELARNDDPQVLFEIESEIIDALQNFASEGAYVDYDDSANSFGCWQVEEEEPA